MPESHHKDVIEERATALFKFLKEFIELRSKTTRLVDSYDQVLWFSDVGREPECKCAAWQRGQDSENNQLWLEIRQPRLYQVPKPPSSLEPWLIRNQLFSSSGDIPELRQEIMVPAKDESGEERLERRAIDDHPEIKPVWERYVESKWRPWAEVDRRAQMVQKVYTQLFSIYQKQQRLGEQYEVVLGLGLLVWRTPDGHDIRRHLIVANASISFDATRGIMSVGPAGEGAKPHLEQDMLDPVHRPDPEELQALENQIHELEDQLWDPSPIDAVLSAWVRSASPKGDYSDSLNPPGAVLSDPQINLAPALILRKRTDRSFLSAFEDIIKQIEANTLVPQGVRRFIHIEDDSFKNEETEAFEPNAVESAQDLFFPLEWNENQRLIVDRLTNNQGVLVQGPPGTGKSHTIVNLLCHLLAHGKRVLVTSHTARALKVIQHFIKKRVPDISPLAVVLLGDDRDALQAMEDSVQGITGRHHLWDPESYQKKINRLDEKLKETRGEEAAVLSELRALRERETYVHPIKFGSYQGTLQVIAARLRREEAGFKWFKDRPSENQEPALSNSQYQELISLLRNKEIDDWKLSGSEAIDVGSLPKPDFLSDFFGELSKAQRAIDQIEDKRSRPEYESLFKTSPETRSRLAEQLTNLILKIDQVTKNRFPWASNAVEEVLQGQVRIWQKRLDDTKRHLACIGSRAPWADEIQITGLGKRETSEVRSDAKAILEHLEKGGKWGIGPFRSAPAKQALYLKREVKIDGRRVQNREELKSLISWLDVEKRLAMLREVWRLVYPLNEPFAFSAQIIEYEERCEAIEVILSLIENKGEIQEIIQSIKGLAEPAWHNKHSLISLRDCSEAVDYEMKFRELEAGYESICRTVEKTVVFNKADPSGVDLFRALKKREINEYRIAFSRLLENKRLSENLERRDSYLSELQKNAPILSDDLIETYTDEKWDRSISVFGAAWNWARALEWIKKLSDPELEQSYIIQIENARSRIRKSLSEIAVLKAWLHCFSRMKENERQSLIAWSKAVRSIGKGTGKYASIHRRNARKHMNECRSAIPAWVMPIYRVAETIKPGSDLFDVVIIDEASQSGPEALLLSYLAKKLIVVGDDKQISPNHAGINHEDVNQLRARHLADIPHADSYGVDHSFFDLAEIRYPGRIRLREHFRCMPEIIQFSNNLCYAGEPLIPLRQYGGSRLQPVVSACHVPNGYIQGVGQHVINPPEAQAIVQKILELHSEKKYQGKTFGVISLLGPAQAREIEKMLLEELGPREMEKRQLVCGDAYAFQGDERDVMFLSMVAAPGEERRIQALTHMRYKQRFNVAASRARDQMFLFHTATINDLSPQCLRYALLQYCQKPSLEKSSPSGRPISELQYLAASADRDRINPPDPFESWFELDVFLQISSRGFRVLPQYAVAGYRIDLVVDGMDRRVAVECDGDRWHGPERYQEDMVRQRMLERCGWRFWRIRGSAYYLDPEASLEDLWKFLERHEVYPQGKEPIASEDTETPETDSVETIQPENLLDIQSLESVEDEPEESVEPDQLDDEDVTSEDLPATNVTIPIENQKKHESPYIHWNGPERFPDPLDGSPEEIVSGLVEIVGVEGPISSNRLNRIYVKAAGRERVSKLIRRKLNRAIWRAITVKGLLEDRVEKCPGGIHERVLRLANHPPISVRPRGDRNFFEIPPSEIAAYMCRLENENTEIDSESVYRETLHYFDTRRMTSNIQKRLDGIYERRHELISIGHDTLPDKKEHVPKADVKKEKSKILFITIGSNHKQRGGEKRYDESQSLTCCLSNYREKLMRHRKMALDLLKSGKPNRNAMPVKDFPINADLKNGKEFGGTSSAYYLEAAKRFDGRFFQEISKDDNRRMALFNNSSHHYLFLTPLYGLVLPGEFLQAHNFHFPDHEEVSLIWTDKGFLTSLVMAYIEKHHIRAVFDMTASNVFRDLIDWKRIRNKSRVLHGFGSENAGPDLLPALGNLMVSRLFAESERELMGIPDNKSFITDYEDVILCSESRPPEGYPKEIEFPYETAREKMNSNEEGRIVNNEHKNSQSEDLE